MSVLGINQYRQRLHGEPLFNAGAGQVATHPIPLSRGEISNPDAGHVANSGEPVNATEIISSLAGLRETLQSESAAVQPAPKSDAKTPTVAPTGTRKSVLLEEPENSSTPTLQQAAQPDTSEQILEQENISFSLACWQVSEEVLVINGFARGEQANRTELELLANILRAIDQLAASLPAAELIEWPLAPGAEGSLSGAKTQLLMFLHGRQQVRPYRCLLAMGDECMRLLMKGDTASPPDSGSAEVIFIPSLQTMLSDPLCKREVWQALRHLRGA